MGIVYWVSDHSDKAIEDFQRAVEIKPDVAKVWYDLGVAYKISGQTAKRMEVYDRLEAADLGEPNEFFNEIVLPWQK